MSNVIPFPQLHTVHPCESRAEAEYKLQNTYDFSHGSIFELNGNWYVEITTNCVSEAVKNMRREWAKWL